MLAMSALSLQGHAGMLVGFAVCLVVVVPLSGAPACSSKDSCARDSAMLQLQQNESHRVHKAAAESALPPFQLPDFRLVNGQKDRACRGGCPSDTDESYYQLRVAVSTLDECQCLCRDDVRCSGVEYNSNGHCKLWHRNGGIMFTAPAEGYSCYRNSFQPVAGGVDRSCRGDFESDDDESYYDVNGPHSLAECKELCERTRGCKGIEHTADGRCAVWKRSIQATASSQGSSCLVFAPQDAIRTQDWCHSQYASCVECEGTSTVECRAVFENCRAASCEDSHDACQKGCEALCKDARDEKDWAACAQRMDYCQTGCAIQFYRCY